MAEETCGACQGIQTNTTKQVNYSNNGTASSYGVNTSTAALSAIGGCEGDCDSCSCDISSKPINVLSPVAGSVTEEKETITQEVNHCRPAPKEQCNKGCDKGACFDWVKNMRTTAMGHLMTVWKGCLYTLKGDGKEGLLQAGKDGLFSVTNKIKVSLPIWNKMTFNSYGQEVELPPESFPYIIISDVDGNWHRLKGYSNTPSEIKWDGDSFHLVTASGDVLATSTALDTEHEVVPIGLRRGNGQFNGIANALCESQCEDTGFINGTFNEEGEHKEIVVQRGQRSGIKYYDATTGTEKIGSFPRGYNPLSCSDSCEEDISYGNNYEGFGFVSTTITLSKASYVEIFTEVNQTPKESYTAGLTTYQLAVGSNVEKEFSISASTHGGSISYGLELSAGQHNIVISTKTLSGCESADRKVSLRYVSHALYCV